MSRKTDWEVFENKYQPIQNHLVEEPNVYLYETFGKDWDFIKNQNYQYVWTVVTGDNGKLYITNGHRLVNRIGYLVTKIPWEGQVRDYLY